MFSLATSSSPGGAVLRAAVQGNVARLLGTAHKRVVVTSQPSGLRRLTQGDVRTNLTVSIPVLASSASYWALVSVLEHNASLPFLKSHVDSGIVWYSAVRYEKAAKTSDPDDAWVVALVVSLAVLAVAGAAVAAYFFCCHAAAAERPGGVTKPLMRKLRANKNKGAPEVPRGQGKNCCLEPCKSECVPPRLPALELCISALSPPHLPVRVVACFVYAASST